MTKEEFYAKLCNRRNIMYDDFIANEQCYLQEFSDDLKLFLTTFKLNQSSAAKEIMIHRNSLRSYIKMEASPPNTVINRTYLGIMMYVREILEIEEPLKKSIMNWA